MVKRWLKRLFLLAVAVGVVGMIVMAFLPKPVLVDVTKVTRGTLRVTVDEDGRTRLRDRYVVASPLTGRMQRVSLKPGDIVEAGKTVLTVLEPTDPTLLDARTRAELEARVKTTDARRKEAQTQLERTRVAEEHARIQNERGRRAGSGVSQTELDELAFKERTAAKDLRLAEWHVQIADSEHEQAKASLKPTGNGSPGEQETWRIEMRSPISGRVLRVFQESAAVVTPGLKILELGDLNDLEIEIDVLSADAVKVVPGAKVYLEHWGGEQPLQAQVRLVEPSGFLKISALGVEEQRVWIIADFLDPLEKRKTLGDGFRVEARIVVWEGTDVVKVPGGALFRHGDGWAVFVVTAGRAQLRPVKIGRSNGLETQVLEGLAEGDELVLHPSDKIHDGVLVTPR